MDQCATVINVDPLCDLVSLNKGPLIPLGCNMTVTQQNLAELRLDKLTSIHYIQWCFDARKTVSSANDNGKQSPVSRDGSTVQKELLYGL